MMRSQAMLPIVVALGLGAQLAPFSVRAQLPAEPAPAEEQESLAPGLKLAAPNGGSSTAIAEAARNRQSISLSDEAPASEPLPSLAQTYTVQNGDTLWSVCERLLGSAYAWPMVWSYNPEITNPHWIYPGQLLYLSQDRPLAPGLAPPLGGDEPAPLMATSHKRAPGAVMLRNRGFVDTQMLARAGEVVGSQNVRRLFAQFDTVYLEFQDGAKIAPGDEFAIYRVLRDVEPISDEGTELGKLVEILGQARVTTYDAKTNIGRAHIDESVQPFERGTLIGPVHRKFDVVPPVANEKDLQGYLVALLDEGVLASSEQIVFIDRGQADGVRQGNRFLAIEKRDKFRESNGEDDDREGYPTEVLAELRVIEARPHTSTCIVLGATRELEVGTKVEMRRGY